VTRDLDANDLSLLAHASLFKAECLSASRVIGRPYSMGEERHAEAGLFHTAKPVRLAKVRMSFFVSLFRRCLSWTKLSFMSTFLPYAM
jgi:hypothetical protein